MIVMSPCARLVAPSASKIFMWIGKMTIARPRKYPVVLMAYWCLAQIARATEEKMKAML